MTPEESALGIQEGACNPCGITRTLVEAIDAAYADGGVNGVADSPAVRLILHQLFYVLYTAELYFDHILRDGINGPPAEWYSDMEACRRAVWKSTEGQ